MAGKAEIEITLSDRIQGRFRELARDAEQLAKALNSVKPDDGQTAVVARQAEQLKKWSGELGNSERAAKSLNSSVKGLGDTVRDFSRNVVGGAGGGTIGSILTSGSIAATVASVGLLIGQSIRMAYEFERVSTKAAQALSLGTGGNGLGAIRAGAYSSRYVSANEMAGAMYAYGVSSGATAAQTAAAAPYIAKYAKAYGLDTGQVASMVGSYGAQANSGNFSGDASGLFGAAESSGQLGRRIGEFIGVATNTLAQLQMGDMSKTYSAQDIGSYIAGIARLGGVFGTSAGESAVQGALGGLSSGGSGDLRKASFMARAGISQYDILNGTNNPEVQKKLLDALISRGGVPGTVGFLASAEGAAGLSQDQARALNAAAMASKRKYGTYSGFLSYRSGGANVDAAYRNYQGSTLAGLDEKQAQVANAMIAGGDKILEIASKLTLLQGAIIALTAAVVANTLAQVGGNLFKFGKFARLGRTAAGLGEVAEAAGGASGILETAAAVAGGGAAALAVGGIGAMGYGVMSAMSRQSYVDLVVKGRPAGLDQDHWKTIVDASKKNGINPYTLAAVAMQESGFGRTLDASGKGDHGHGYGWFQLDDRSHTPQELEMARTNFGYAANKAAAMLATNIARYHGDTHAALNAYNSGQAGDAGTTYTAGLPYASSVERYQKQLVASSGSTQVVDAHGARVTINVRVDKAPAPSPGNAPRIARVPTPSTGS